MGTMFILYAVLVGLLIGVVSGGTASRLGRLRFRWAALVAIGMIGQLLLFSTPVGDRLGDLAPYAYIASNVIVLAAVARNLSIPGLILVLFGGASNVVAIVANAGYMPVSPEALAAMGRAARTGYSNSVLLQHVTLAPLTDIFAMPTFVPAANVFSIGDILIGVGAAMAIVYTVHGRAPLIDDTPDTGVGASAH
jgi:Family of unknown function (DUF5317)